MTEICSNIKIKKMKIVAIGGTGLIGSQLVQFLQKSENQVVAASPNTGVNSITT